MPSKVVRFVFQEKVNYNVLKTFIEDRVALKGKIKTIYTRRCTFLDNGYAYVIFEQECDAEMTVQVLNGVKLDINVIDVALIGPKEQYKRYMTPLNMIGRNHKLSQNINTSSLLKTKSECEGAPVMNNFVYRRDLISRISKIRPKIETTEQKSQIETRPTSNISKIRPSLETTEPKYISGLRHSNLLQNKDWSDLLRRFQDSNWF